MATKRQNKKAEVIVTDTAVTLTEQPQDISVKADVTVTDSTEEVVEVNLQDEIGREVDDLKNLIVEYQSKIKDAKKRINDLTKKTGEKSAKSKIIEWYVKQPTCTYLEFVNYAVGVEGISGIYCNTLWKQVSK
jgi:hypothetical protein